MYAYVTYLYFFDIKYRESVYLRSNVADSRRLTLPIDGIILELAEIIAQTFVNKVAHYLALDNLFQEFSEQIWR